MVQAELALSRLLFTCTDALAAPVACVTDHAPPEEDGVEGSEAEGGRGGHGGGAWGGEGAREVDMTVGAVVLREVARVGQVGEIGTNSFPVKYSLWV